MDVAQTASFLQSMTYETGILDYEDFPITPEPVWLLGCQYSAIEELDLLKGDFLSRFWFTYRRGYTPIGGTGPTTDTGWGCMLRCGQMMLAQALVNRHLGRGWRWTPGKYDPKSFEILRMFLDKKGSKYSIHQIASMGASEGKSVGEWFGPNTIAQVLKKLAIYDDWSNVAIHVALDNTVIVDDLRHLSMGPTMRRDSQQSPERKSTYRQGPDGADSSSHCYTVNAMPNSPSVLLDQPRKKSSKTSCDIMSSSMGSVNGYNNDKNKGKKKQKDLRNSREKMCNSCGSLSSSGSGLDSLTSDRDLPAFRPVLLIIPLRLGLSEINPVYISSLKKCLMFPQSVGIIGGKPNHAHYFVGYVGDQLLYLDPHTTQYYIDVTEPEQTDESYHCDYISRMKINSLDPSIALGFFCGSEQELDDLCQRIRTEIIQSEKTPMFELHEHRPLHWPPFEPYSPDGALGMDNFTVVEEADRHFDTDEEFELL